MKHVRNIVTKALEIRAKESVKVRQPIQTLETKVKIISEYAEIIKDEVNVKNVEFNSELEADVWLDITITPELKKEGDAREFIRVIQDLRKATGLSQEDTIVIHAVHTSDFKEILETYSSLIKNTTRTQEIITVEALPTEDVQVNSHTIKLIVQKV
jgi:isoleucyl-tRNA synthetase